MKLCIKQKIFTFLDKFTVFDIYGNDLYYVEGEFSLFAKKLHIMDTFGNELLCLQQRVFRFFPTVDAISGGNRLFGLTKCFSFVVPKYTVDEMGWEIEGDFFAHNYTISANGSPIAQIQKEWFTFGDCYTIDFPDNARNIETYYLAVLIGIDIIVAASNN